MNQILKIKNSNKIKKHQKKLKIQLFISLTAIVVSSIFGLYSYNIRLEKESLSNLLLNNFNIENIYSKNQNYAVLELNNKHKCFIIGVVEIPKINVKYPILSDTNDELLKISACRFYGPNPNKVGNLCIAAHNYDDNRFFSNLYQLNIGDSINIYDTSNSLVSYYIYDKYEISKNDTSCTNQNTNGKREITLLTCNNVTKNRLIVKASEL